MKRGGWAKRCSLTGLWDKGGGPIPQGWHAPVMTHSFPRELEVGDINCAHIRAAVYMVVLMLCLDLVRGSVLNLKSLPGSLIRSPRNGSP